MRLHLFRLGTTPVGAPVPGYLLRLGDGTNVLIDTGFPPDATGPKAFVRVTAEERVTARLAAEGLRPEDVHLVVCTHLDPDHAGNHDLFPGSEFVVQRAHHELALSGSVPRLEMARAHWDLPHLKYRHVEGDTDLLPGVRLVESPGHIAGHQSVLVRLPRTGAVLLAADAIPSAEHLDPGQRAMTPFDTDEDAVRASTRKLLDLAEAENALLVRGHDAEQWATLRTGPGEYYD
ncbi:N-acyl homoserine lactone hydrolase [Streptomyces olivoverticillatus]|uniref:N-acyl homoserine lactone hydrolase n=1 Tax=Streptomyces olivoverticillatus TaxID=66427 RepID=A0A7W7LRV0_9ACTN|nr:N-acyl homoserine lactonase family protein [Streptomyces olivoverticillatus]MBB4895200.1 N-acyl homoserine lactone hydrolase [Streptomyces olivoverticillatus]